jgi:hypothetical protein
MEMLDNDVNREAMESSCLSLLKAMEIEDREEVWIEDVGETFEPEEESLNLPSEWLYGYADGSDKPDQTLMYQMSTEGNAKSSDVQQIDTAPGTMIQGKDGKVAKSKTKEEGMGSCATRKEK